MDKLIDFTMAARTEIRDFDTVLKLMWVEMADLPETEAIDAVCKTLQMTIK